MSWTKNAVFKLQLLLCISAILYFQFKENQNLKTLDIKIITYSNVVESSLAMYKDLIGTDYNGYRNHIYRVLTYSRHFLDGDESNIDVIASALVYHDIGLWTAGTLAYLEPSAQLARAKCAGTFTPEQLKLQEDIINHHHKIWPYTESGGRIIEAVRKADWIDASYGILNKGMPRSYIVKVQSALPAAGFYDTLMDFGPRLHGSNVVKILTEIVQIFKW